MTVLSKASTSSACMSAPLALRRSIRRTVLAYHELSQEVTNYSYALSCRQFQDHLQFVARLGPAPPPLTFDDGHISNYTHALPLLEQYACKAIFFVIAGRIGRHRDFMTWAQLQELTALGHQVQAHSWSHKFLTECSDSDLREELSRSRETLQDRLGKTVDAISAPHGRWDRRVLQACADAGYSRLYSSEPWPARGSVQVEVIGRLMVNQSMDSARILYWLTMGRAEAAMRRAPYVLKRAGRRILGNKLYYRLWTRFSGWNGPDDTFLEGRS